MPDAALAVPRRRLVLDALDGRLIVRDLRHPAAELADLDLPDGRHVQVAADLCGWLAEDRDHVLWRTPAEAQEALSDDGGGWAAALEAAAALTAPIPRAPLPPDQEAQLARLCRDHPSLWLEGPHPREGGGWYMVITGPSDLGWALGQGATPQAAAADALAQIERA